MIWYDVTWLNMMWCDMTWFDVMWYNVMWCDMMWCDMIRYDVIWYDMTWCDVMWYGVNETLTSSLFPFSLSRCALFVFYDAFHPSLFCSFVFNSVLICSILPPRERYSQLSCNTASPLDGTKGVLNLKELVSEDRHADGSILAAATTPPSNSR
jgi:hypothetical protein